MYGELSQQNRMYCLVYSILILPEKKMRILQELHKKGGVLSLPFCCQTPHPPPPPPKKNIQTKTLRSGVSPNYTCNT